jgi:hypothetical protein
MSQLLLANLLFSRAEVLHKVICHVYTLDEWHSKLGMYMSLDRVAGAGRNSGSPHSAFPHPKPREGGAERRLPPCADRLMPRLFPSPTFLGRVSNSVEY